MLQPGTGGWSVVTHNSDDYYPAKRGDLCIACRAEAGGVALALALALALA